MARRVGYGIDFRNMHTAVHGIAWTRDKRIADDLYDVFLALESDDPTTVDFATEDLEYYFKADKVFLEEEINFRDITSDSKYYLDDGNYIIILNSLAFDVYM